ncbi:MAG: DUF4097 family beta strand repeat protein [Eubacterium sp.]|nr:DUF4097 family beta strand repeat protein [Eubacterium sp.]
MKKGKKIAILILIILFVLGSVMLIVGIANGGNVAFNIDYANKKISTTSKENLYEGTETPESFKNINIDIPAADINIKHGNEYKIEYHFYSSNAPIITTDNDTFNMNTGKTKVVFSYGFVFDSNKDDGYINITVPENVDLENVTLDLSAGDVTIDGMNISDLDLDLSAGDAKLSNGNIGNIIVDASSGDVSLDSITGNQVKVTNSAGDFNMKNSTFEKLDTDLSAGSVDVTESKISNVKIDNTAGNVDLSLIGEESDYSIKTDVTAGSTTVNGEKKHGSFEVVGGSKKIDIDSSAGSVNIDIK